MRFVLLFCNRTVFLDLTKICLNGFTARRYALRLQFRKFVIFMTDTWRVKRCIIIIIIICILATGTLPWTLLWEFTAFPRPPSWWGGVSCLLPKSLTLVLGP